MDGVENTETGQCSDGGVPCMAPVVFHPLQLLLVLLVDVWAVSVVQARTVICFLMASEGSECSQNA